MKETLKKYLNTQFVKNDMKICIEHCTDAEIFYYVLLFKEGMDLSIEIVKTWFDYAKDILDVSDKG